MERRCGLWSVWVDERALTALTRDLCGLTAFSLLAAQCTWS